MTPLQKFLDVLHSTREFGELTDLGVEKLRQLVTLAVPHMPAIVLTGNWADLTGGATADAITALTEAQEPFMGVANDEQDLRFRNEVAAHIVGLLTGLALAPALTGATEGDHAPR